MFFWRSHKTSTTFLAAQQSGNSGQIRNNKGKNYQLNFDKCCSAEFYLFSRIYNHNNS